VYNIGLIGKKRSGKDTAALHLVHIRAYTRLAFADPLKEMALSLDPLIPTGIDSHGRIYTRLSRLIADVGWEYAKDHYAEIRRILQRTGHTVREYDKDFWLRPMRQKLNNAERWNVPVIITDVRYPNEAEMLRQRGFRLVRIVRPEPLSGYGDTHESETALDDYAADVTIHNGGSLAGLHAAISAV
jgi:hypothetical protein